MLILSTLLAQVGGVDSPLVKGTFMDNKFFNPEYWFPKFVAVFNYVTDPTFRSGFEDIFHAILYFLTIFFMTVICYSFIRTLEIRKKEHRHLHHEIHEYAEHKAEQDKKKLQGDVISHNPRWVTTLNYLFSSHDSDWKLAIIEADAILEELMTSLGFKGVSLGERLKNANQGNFRSLTKAWEVHTIRNRIAHEGESFNLSQHEAKRVIAIYEQIFREYGFI